MKVSDQFVDINNSRQNILTMLSSVENPILLIVHGGPGSPDRPLVCKYNSELSKYYTVVCWDQRGSGLSYSNANKENGLTIELMLSDLKELVVFLLAKYKKEKLYIAGHSWGAYLGLRFVSEYPQYVKYYIGTGQGISSFVDEIYKYNFVLDKAEKLNDVKVVQKLKDFGAPSGMEYYNQSEEASAYVGKLVHKYGGYIHPESRLNMNTYFSEYLTFYRHNIFRVLAGINYSVKSLNSQINSEDKITPITEINVPILLISGEQDFVCPVPAVRQWFEKLVAPKKNFVIIKKAAHMVNFEKPSEWNNELIKIL